MAQVFALLGMVVVGEEEGWREEDEKAEQWFKVRSRMLRDAKNSHDDTRPDLDIQSTPIFRLNLHCVRVLIHLSSPICMYHRKYKY